MQGPDPPEEWREVPGYEGFYEVSDQGGVRSLPRRYCKGQALKGVISGTGHTTVTLSRPGTPVWRVSVHRLVALTFIANPDNLPVVRHWNDDPADNTKGNLRWGTYSDNTNDMVRNGNHPRARNTHCPHGHEFTKENTYFRRNPFARRCRACTLKQNSASSKRRRASSLLST